MKRLALMSVLATGLMWGTWTNSSQAGGGVVISSGYNVVPVGNGYHYHPPRYYGRPVYGPPPWAYRRPHYYGGPGWYGAPRYYGPGYYGRGYPGFYPRSGIGFSFGW